MQYLYIKHKLYMLDQNQYNTPEKPYLLQMWSE